MKYPDDFINKIICGDCLDVMKDIPNNSVDLIVTDPPYAIGMSSNGSKASNLDNNIIKPFFVLFIKNCKRILKLDGELYCNTDWRTYPFLYQIFCDYMIIKNCIVWDYEWIKAGSHYRFSHEFIIYAIKEKNVRKFSASERDVWRIPPINFTSSNKLHQAEKPIELNKKMIVNSSKIGDIVLDPFCGSGSTLVAAKQLNRQFIGIEISERCCKIAHDRLESVSPLFDNIQKDNKQLIF